MIELPANFAPALFAGKTVLVDGGISGISLNIARRFSDLGASLFVTSRWSGRVADAVADLSRSGPAAGAAADRRDLEAMRSAVAECVWQFGAVDIAVSGAAEQGEAPTVREHSGRGEFGPDIDLLGTFNVCRAVYPALRKPGASIVNISTARTWKTDQAQAFAAKAGIDALTRVLAMEWGLEGVRVNAIAPGWCDGFRNSDRPTLDPGHEERGTGTSPRYGDGRSAEIVDAAVFLCSPAGAGFNGETGDVDPHRATLDGSDFAFALEELTA
ncbi:SDR family oxidoreductase [Sinimarinibacterium sp. CAU 1509]|uniref:SDR family oxidoreductase n=1 Tax=Sinimarinibacterium sp. CAU 1509 TaxID=2562283 RepID=UPI0010AC72F2|nr:SDR family oxidoreductase [Sinimarinibacterium sp. CAU 1509]TJY64800.1 SDR family oxidoreductase [Sinimarinibacterium sp. CAU 1509]